MQYLLNTVYTVLHIISMIHVMQSCDNHIAVLHRTIFMSDQITLTVPRTFVSSALSLKDAASSNSKGPLHGVRVLDLSRCQHKTQWNPSVTLRPHVCKPFS